ncbi:hypothetical protein GSI_09591 [Ganoderma sinense ZZ0214-1]|uniref:Uncharacterized protein n=1 Tax=Ganoderma sinense ZZ0214-1 TaxID=1077348 RepID=A0A2G8S3G6_9APHY|nr:hypothetical protein GSI_09591 [Ganoderma sinense ZZ0214-1]
MVAIQLRNSTHVSNFTINEVNTPAFNIILDSATSAPDSMIEVSLSSLLFGVLTILSLTAIFFLVRQGSLTQTNTRVLILSTGLLYLSTGTYVAALMWNRSQAKNLVLGATKGLFSASYSDHWQQDIAAFEDAVWKQSWMTATALVLNPSGPRHAQADSPTVFGILGYRDPRVVPTTRVTLLITNNAFIKAAAAVSFATNALATALIAYKMWKHRQLVKKHFSASGVKSRVLNALALLVECGSVYCALLIFVMIHEEDPQMPRAGAGKMFTRLVEIFIYGCLTPLVAIYPTIIIVMVALKRSPIDTGMLSQVYQSYGPRTGPVVDDDLKARESTVVFRLSTIRSFPGREMEDMVEGTYAGDHHGVHSDSWESTGSTNQRSSKAIENLV